MRDWVLSAILSPSTDDGVLTAGIWWFTVFWLGILGGCIGSFFNVVWDRRGTGKGIVFPPSHCPRCGHKIRWYHNVPILGWLILRGRCYDCGGPISVKHPLVEGLFALLFMLAGVLSPWL